MKKQKGRESKVAAKGVCRKSRERGGTVAGGLKMLAGDPPAWGLVELAQLEQGQQRAAESQDFSRNKNSKHTSGASGRKTDNVLIENRPSWCVPAA